jgi:hypothetical protein
MRLIGIKPVYFRAFGNSDWINLNSNLVVIYGPNGYGKTSISEALEWLLYGKTRRRERGETLSQREYQGSYRNVHAPTSHPTSVEAKLKAANGTEYQIKRELQIGARNVESSVTFIDAAPADFSTIGLSMDELYKPVIAQDKVVRRCVELLIRAVCRRTNSTSPPYDSTAGNMLPFFCACPGTTAAQAHGISQTITFSNPGPHTQIGWTVPVETNITPHIDRIRQTAQQLGVW